MKYLSLLFFIMSTISNLFAEEWYWQAPSPDGTYLEGLFNIGKDTIVVLGKDGTISMSTDTGTTWDNRKRAFLPDVSLSYRDPFDTTSIRFILRKDISNESHHYFSRLNMYTSKLDTFPVCVTATNASLNDIVFLSSDSGWIVGDKDLLMKTTNGGKNWISMPSGNNGLHNQAILEKLSKTFYLLTAVPDLA